MYDIPETEGPTFEEVNQILQNTNENKASSGIIKPQIIKLGSIWSHRIIYQIVRQIWTERNGDCTTILN